MTRRYAWYMVILLTAVNFVNYVDRQIIISLRLFIQDELHLSYAQFGLLITAFMLIHSLTSVPFGILSDRWIRQKIIALGVCFWSAATFVSGLSTSFVELLSWRAAVGIGEAAYAPPANSLLSGAFPVRERARILGVFNLGMFAGAATGLMLGGILGEKVGWRICLFLASVPGFLLAGLAWHLHEPAMVAAHTYTPRQGLLALFRNRLLIYVCGGGIISAFSVGALIVWMPQFLTDVRYFRPGEAGLYIGSIGAAAGVLGVLVGSSLADWLYMHWPWGRMAIIGVGMILSSPFVIFALYATSHVALMTHIFFAIFFMVWYTGPIIAVIHEVVPPELKATAQGLYIFLIHLLGDTPSPWIIGWLADFSSLQTALLPLPIINIVGGLIFLAGCREITRESYRQQKHSSATSPELPRTGTLGL